MATWTNPAQTAATASSRSRGPSLSISARATAALRTPTRPPNTAEARAALRTARVACATVTSAAAPPERKVGAHWITQAAAVAQSEPATTPRLSASASNATRAASICRARSSTSRRNGPRSSLPTPNDHAPQPGQHRRRRGHRGPPLLNGWCRSHNKNLAPTTDTPPSSESTDLPRELACG